MIPITLLCFDCPYIQTKHNECGLISSLCSIYGYYYFHPNEIPKLKILKDNAKLFVISHLQEILPSLPLIEDILKKKQFQNSLTSDLMTLKKEKMKEIVEQKISIKIFESIDINTLKEVMDMIYEIISTLKTDYNINFDYIQTLGNIFELNVLNAERLMECKTFENVCMFLVECGEGVGKGRKNLKKPKGIKDAFIPLFDVEYFEIKNSINHFMYSKLDELEQDNQKQINAFDPINRAKSVFKLNKKNILKNDDEEEDCVVSDIYYFTKN